MPSKTKTCFVTIGATASFHSLITAVLSPDFLSALEKLGYTDLLIQYGKDGQELFSSQLTTAKNSESGSVLNITGFAIDKTGLAKYMKQAKGGNGNGNGGQGQEEGVVISHAGSGTILDALRLQIPLIVVPNPTLLDNHQVELAEALAEQEYVVYGRLGELAFALEEAERLRVNFKTRDWRQNAGYMRQTNMKTNTLKGVVDDEMGYLD